MYTAPIPHNSILGYSSIWGGRTSIVRGRYVGRFVKVYNDHARSILYPGFPFPTPSLQGSLENMNDTMKKHSIEHFEFVEGTGSDSAPFIDPIAEKKLLRKIDLRILPP
jgi:hypothetical protein